MRKRKLNFKRPKSERTNSGIALYTGRPLPFSVGTVIHEYILPPKKPRPINKEEWLVLVKENEQKPKKEKKSVPGYLD